MTRQDTEPRAMPKDPLAVPVDAAELPRGRHSLSGISRAAKAWWAHQPAHLAVDFARPVLGRYAERQPLKLLGIAAGVGAAAVLLRPWRLISVGAVLLAAVKSVAVPSVLMSMLSSGSDSSPRQDEQP
jgi:hypothetical protein